jgi:hypothetical protein
MMNRLSTKEKNMSDKIVSTLILFALLLAFSGCKEGSSCVYNESAETLKCSDATYKTVKVNGKTWLAENLRRKVPDSSFCYGDARQNCDKYGRLYVWDAAIGRMYAPSKNPLKGICPNGWHIPAKQDFEAALASNGSAALNIVPAGFRYYDDSYVDENRSASFWTSSEFDTTRAYLVRLGSNGTTFEHYNKKIACSLRCVMD